METDWNRVHHMYNLNEMHSNGPFLNSEVWQRINKDGPKTLVCCSVFSCARSCTSHTKVYNKLIQGQKKKKSTAKYKNIPVSRITYLVRVYSLSPECRFMAENVPIQPLNRLSLPIFHVTKSGLKKRHKKSSWKKPNVIFMHHKTTDVLLQSHDFNSPDYFPSNITR